jgi:hypothetical protein
MPKAKSKSDPLLSVTPNQPEIAKLKPYHKNPRQISPAQQKKLSDNLERLGDISGIVHNVTTGEIIGGNQRAAIFKDGTIELVAPPTAPDAQGTVAHGFIVWRGQRFAYRQVQWNEEQAEEANIIANLSAGDWDWDVLTGKWKDPAKLKGWGLGDDRLRSWAVDAAALTARLHPAGPTPAPINAEDHWIGMPEFRDGEITAYHSVIVHFQTPEALLAFEKLLQQTITSKTKYIWYPFRADADGKSLGYKVAEPSPKEPAKKSDAT